MKLPVRKEEFKTLLPRESKVVFSPDQILEKRATGEITSSEGLDMLQKYVRATFPQERIVKMLDEMCKAEDIRSSQFGPYKTPNWIARDKGLERVFRLLSLGETTNGAKQAPTKMVFNIISNSPVNVEQKEEKRG